MTLGAEFGTGQVVWSLFVLAWFVLVAWLFVTLFTDIVRSDDLAGWGKAAWTLGVLVVPLLGGFVYLIVRGDSMSRRLVQDGLRAPLEPVGGSAENELFRLRALYDAGVITDDELRRATARLTSSSGDPTPKG